MNTSRDIEKLFDHFGGNAGDYQEIGRENEAQSARTRWPLLATLDLAQPAIPEIAHRRDARADAPRPHTLHTPQATPAPGEPSAAPSATPINRGKPPLFARAHRRAIPPVNAKESLDALSGSRFAALADGDATKSETQPEETPSAPSAEFGRVPTASTAIPRANNSAFSQTQAQTQTQSPNLFPRRQPHAPAPEASPSILGKLFDAPKAAPDAPASNSLNALFDRLRASGDDPHNDQDNRPARAWASRS
jgi:hypothetical protein